MTKQLEPSPRNELCKGILDQETEQRLLAQGYTYARRVYHPDGKYHLRTATTPIDEIAVAVLMTPRPKQITMRIANMTKV